MKILLLLAVATLLSYGVNGQTPVPDPRYRLITGNNFVQAKNYYLLTLFEEDAAARKLLEEDTMLAAITKNKYIRMNMALAQCTNNASCITEQLKFSEQEIHQIRDRLRKLYTMDNALGKLVRNHLYPSGTYILFSSSSPVDMWVKAWETVRLIFRYGMPMDKPCLVTTTRYQSNLITSSFIERCRRELHEVPYKVGKRLSETDAEFFRS
jgi:hypothetical protein